MYINDILRSSRIWTVAASCQIFSNISFSFTVNLSLDKLYCLIDCAAYFQRMFDLSTVFYISEKEGIYSSRWSFYHTKEKKFFGDVVWCKVKVVEFCESPSMRAPAKLTRRGSLSKVSDQSPTEDHQSRAHSKQSCIEESFLNGQTSEEEIPTMMLEPVHVEDKKYLYNGTDESDVGSVSSSDESEVSSFVESADEKALDQVVSLYQDHKPATKTNVNEQSESESAKSLDLVEEDDELAEPGYYEEDDYIQEDNSDVDDTQNDDDEITASIADMPGEGSDHKQSPVVESPLDMPKLKKEVSDLHEAFQQRVQVKLDFEALPKSCIQVGTAS